MIGIAVLATNLTANWRLIRRIMDPLLQQIGGRTRDLRDSSGAAQLKCLALLGPLLGLEGRAGQPW